MRYTIYTENVNEFSRIAGKAYLKGDPRDESVYVDVQEEKIYFHYPSRYQGYLLTSIEEEPGSRDEGEEDIQGFHINLPAFLALCEEYPKFSIDPNSGRVEHENDSYQVGTIVEEHFSIDFSYNEGEHFRLRQPEIDLIDNAFSFTPSGKGVIEDRDYSGVSILENSAAGSNSIALYEGYLDFSVGDTPMLLGPEVGSLIHFAKAQGTDVDVYRRTYDGGREHYFMVVGPMVISYVPYNSLHYPAVNEPSFREKFEHATYIETSVKVLLDILRFFSRFRDSGGNADSYVRVQVSDEDDPHLYIGYFTSKNTAMREVPVNSISKELAGHESYFEHSSLQQALRVMGNEKDRGSDRVRIYLPVDDSKPAVDVIQVGEDAKAKDHVVLRRFKA